MSQKLIIAKPGFNALTETDPNNLVFSSDYGTLKYYLSGNTTITVPANGGAFSQENVIVTHNLNYYPFFTCFTKELALERYYNMPYTFADAFGYIRFLAYATTTQLIFRCEMSSNASDFNITVWYKIFKNNLGL